MYIYYQKLNQKNWLPVQADRDLTALEPEFVTILSTNILLDSSSPNDLVETVKRSGPLYFDLDSADIEESIECCQELYGKLLAAGLQASDITLHISGSKGFHVTVPMACFAPDKPLLNLHKIYKELAFKLATIATDFRVYSGRAGRMWRTTVHQRSNGKYKVPITPQELADMTPETYALLCSSPRYLPPNPPPTFRPDFALAFDAAMQKVGTQRRPKPKPLDPHLLKQDLGIVKMLLDGKSPESYNSTFLQLAIVAHANRWTEDSLVEQAAGLIASEGSDRYRSPKAIERGLRNLYHYVEGNPGYEYNSQAIRALLPKTPMPKLTGEVLDPVIEALMNDEGQVFITADSVRSRTSEGNSKEILKMAITKLRAQISLPELQMPNSNEDHALVGIQVTGMVENADKPRSFTIPKSAFTGSTAMAVSAMQAGISFTGTDTDARNLYNLLMSTLRKTKANTYVSEREGMDLLKIPDYTVNGVKDEELSKGFLAWTDTKRVSTKQGVLPPEIDIQFSPLTPDVTYNTDLAGLEDFNTWKLRPCVGGKMRNIDEVRSMFKNLFASNNPRVIGPILGWMVAAIYKQAFHAYGEKFPLLHVVGSAGLGKTETVQTYLRLFYQNANIQSTTPESSLYSIQQMIQASASIPLLIDEYKPAEMSKEKLSEFRAMLRAIYNQKPVVRAGGSRTNSTWQGINKQHLTAPVIVVSEAMEVESAIMERVVVATFTKPNNALHLKYWRNFQEFKEREHLLAHVGQELAAYCLETYNRDLFNIQIKSMLIKSQDRFLPSPDDTPEEAKHKIVVSSRTLTNYTYLEYGLLQLSGFFARHFPGEFKDELRALEEPIYEGMDTLGNVTQAEYLKMLSIWAAMSWQTDNPNITMVYGQDYRHTFMGRRTLELNIRTCFYKYRIYCQSIGMRPLYVAEDSVIAAFEHSPCYISTGASSLNSPLPSMFFDVELLLTERCARFKEGK